MVFWLSSHFFCLVLVFSSAAQPQPAGLIPYSVSNILLRCFFLDVPLLVLIQQQIIEQQVKHQAELEAKFEAQLKHQAELEAKFEAQLKHQADQHQAELEEKLKELEENFKVAIVR